MLFLCWSFTLVLYCLLTSVRNCGEAQLMHWWMVIERHLRTHTPEPGMDTMGDTSSTWGSYHLAHWPYIHSRWLALASDGGCSWGILTCVWVFVCVQHQKQTIGTRLSSAILPSSLISPDHLLRWCICAQAYVWVCRGWCPFIVTAQRGLKAQKWLRESLRLLSL